MQKRLFLLSTIVFLLLIACSLFSPAPAPTQPVGQAEAASSTPGLIPNASPTGTDLPSASPVPPTATPLPPSSTPTASPTPTHTPETLVLGPENAGRIAQVFDYADAFLASTGKDIFDLTMRSYALAGDGSRLAFGLCSSNDSSFICSGEADNNVLVLNTADGSLARYFELGSSGRLAEIALSADGETLYTLRTDVSKTTTVEAWDVDSGSASGMVLRVNGRLDVYPRLCLSPDGRFIAASLGPLGITVYALSEQAVVFTGSGNYGRCRFSQDGQNLIVFLRDANSAGRGLVTFDTTTWTQGPRIDFQAEAIGLSVSPNGKQVAVVHDEFAVIWDLSTRSEVARLEGPTGSVWHFKDLAFSPDGRMLAALFRDFENPDYLQIGNLWETGEWEVLSPIAGTSLESLAIRFDSSGEQFVIFDWYGPAQRFALPDKDLLAARDVLNTYLRALSTGEYRQAADLFRLDPLDTSLPEWIRSQGGNPEDMTATFAIGCKEDEFPCLPLLDVKFFGRVPWDSYLFVVTFITEDGSAYIGEDGYSDFWMYAGLDAEGGIRITTLHPGLFTP